MRYPVFDEDDRDDSILYSADMNGYVSDSEAADSNTISLDAATVPVLFHSQGKEVFRVDSDDRVLINGQDATHEQTVAIIKMLAAKCRYVIEDPKKHKDV